MLVQMSKHLVGETRCGESSHFLAILLLAIQPGSETYVLAVGTFAHAKSIFDLHRRSFEFDLYTLYIFE